MSTSQDHAGVVFTVIGRLPIAYITEVLAEENGLETEEMAMSNVNLPNTKL
jgi:hypothetical protein